MKAGRELDAKVAERLGWKNLYWKEAGHEQKWDGGRVSHITWPGGWYGDGPDGMCYLDKSYSTSIAAAWELWERARVDWPIWIAFVEALLAQFDWEWSEEGLMRYEELLASLNPHAICLAFLKATDGQ